jgi:antitoxin VapB
VSLNIKNERTTALIRELAERTGETQTAAVETAVRRRLDELDRHNLSEASNIDREQARRLLLELRSSLTDTDRAAVKQAEAQHYDENGPPA